MDLQVLVSTMHQNDLSILQKMNIQSNAIIINQTNKNSSLSCDYEGHDIKLFSYAERGIGLSRNNALMRATADIALFADDDVVYVDNYKMLIIDAFKNNPKADIIVFNVPSTNPDRPLHFIKSKGRVRFYNCLKYGAVSIAVRTTKIKQANVYFSLLFGGGARYSAGEDSLFLAECIKKGLKVYTDPTVIGRVNQEKSSWFEGYNEKYFIDKAVFYYCLSKRWAYLLCLQDALRHHKSFYKEKSLLKILALMQKGVRLAKE
ncbi:glycosyltransferase family A protein [Bacillus sp. AFS040349]|uniref:glycosyltransferase family A protein n=1 Tax=Bacillus sp. AFS040349 TaxID=2033502 RepID=UPI000BFB7B25|nr:glycosyltransferase family A protein [Bacillus sp. AFS040349]PGT89050.1 glycosyl transferase 2 [Bacillus sp. AFS040349]